MNACKNREQIIALLNKFEKRINDVVAHPKELEEPRAGLFASLSKIRRELLNLWSTQSGKMLSKFPELEKRYFELELMFQTAIREIGLENYQRRLHQEELLHGTTIKEELGLFRESLKRLRKPVREGKDFQQELLETISAKEKTGFILDKMERSRKTRVAFRKKAMELNIEFENIKKKIGEEEYLKTLHNTLKKLLRAFDHASRHESNYIYDFEDDLETCDLIEFILKELGNKAPNYIRKELRSADSKFKKIAPRLIRKFGYNLIEDYYPKSFWWRHLKNL